MEKGDGMAKSKGVSGKTHTPAQLKDFANQNNPNSKAYKARKENEARTSSRNRKNKKYDVGILDGESYGWCDD